MKELNEEKKKCFVLLLFVFVKEVMNME